MSALRFISKLLSLVPKAAEAYEAVATRLSRKPPPPRSNEEMAMRDVELSEIYKDKHAWTRFGPHLPPQTCIYCKQPIATASKFCPGVPRE